MNYLIHAKRFGAQSAQQTHGLKVQLKRSYIMKLAVFLSVLFSIQIASGTMAQKIDLQADKQSLLSVLQEIRKQSGYAILYNAKDIATASPVTIHVKGKPISEVLPILFKNQPLLYELKGRVISIEPKPANTKKNGQRETLRDQEPIRGRVTDSTGMPLSGVTVRIIGTDQSTATNADGYFEFSTVSGNPTIVFSIVGYEQKAILIDNLTSPIVLYAQRSEIAEVLVSKGYYATTKELNTGSVSSVKADVLERQPVGDPLLALSGRVPGLYIQQNSGLPGIAPSFRLRGQNSIANGNNPLFVVDGVPYISSFPTNFPSVAGGGARGDISPFASIPIQSIESIDVLKDADATAIYGSRGANGVILITTKKAKTDRTSLTADFNRGAGSVSRMVDLLNTEQFLAMRREAFANDGVAFGSTDYDVNGTWDQSRYTDWQDVMIGGTAQLTSAGLNINGGNSQTQFSISGNYRHETTVFPGDSRNKQYGTHINASHESQNKRFRISYSGLLSNLNLLVPQNDFMNNILLAPNAPALYNNDGTLNWENSTWQNPFYALDHTSTSTTKNLNNDLTLSYKILSGLKISSRFGFNESGRKTTNLTPIKNNDPIYAINPANRSHTVGNYEVKSWNIEPMLSYDHNLANGIFNALVGSTFQEIKSEQYQINASGFSSDEMIKNLGAASTVTLRNVNEIQYRYSAIYARLGYTHKERYIVNLTGRRDGSSRFGSGKQYGNFGAIGAAWIFSKESFFPKSDIISSGKFRASYGVTGNDQLGDYKYISAYSAKGGNYQGVTGLTPIQHTNPNYGWETVNKFETALELGLLNEKMHLSVNWYRNRTTNQLVGYSLPLYTGFASVQANLPAIIQNTGTEIELNASILNKRNLQWSADFNISVPRNKLVSYPELENSTYRTRYALGKSLNGSFLYHFTGLDPETKIPTFEDLNGDTFIRSADDRRHNFVGQKYFAGLNNSFTLYRNFQLDIFLQYIKQNSYEFFSAYQPGLNTAEINLASYVLDDNSDYSYFTQSFSSPAYQAYNLFFLSDAALGDASFLRLKNVNLSWTVDNHILNTLKLKNLKLYIQGQNLLTFTKYRGLDPEIGRGLPPGLPSLPSLRMVTFGIQLTL